MGEDIIVIFRRDVAGEAGLVERLVARLSVLKVSEPPAARLGVEILSRLTPKLYLLLSPRPAA
jgi:hypothetical protein